MQANDITSGQIQQVAGSRTINGMCKMPGTVYIVTLKCGAMLITGVGCQIGKMLLLIGIKAGAKTGCFICYPCCAFMHVCKCFESICFFYSPNENAVKSMNSSHVK